jgi:pathogenesis-related protein 1
VRVFAGWKAGVLIAVSFACILPCVGADESLGGVQRSQNREEMSQQMLEAHNRIRRSRGVEPLAWSDALAGYAKPWADQLAAEGRLYHHPNPKYGENLYMISGGEASPDKVVDAWASEQNDYDYKSNSCRSRCGHYTQIVWRDSKQVGCAAGQSGKVQVWVCEYNPPGNVIGERPY